MQGVEDGERQVAGDDGLDDFFRFGRDGLVELEHRIVFRHGRELFGDFGSRGFGEVFVDAVVAGLRTFDGLLVGHLESLFGEALEHEHFLQLAVLQLERNAVVLLEYPHYKAKRLFVVLRHPAQQFVQAKRWDSVFAQQELAFARQVLQVLRGLLVLFAQRLVRLAQLRYKRPAVRSRSWVHFVVVVRGSDGDHLAVRSFLDHLFVVEGLRPRDGRIQRDGFVNRDCRLVVRPLVQIALRVASVRRAIGLWIIFRLGVVLALLV